MKIYSANSFDLTCIKKDGYSPRRFYENASRINHACSTNNADYSFTKEEHIVVRAKMHIKEGQEITVDYIGAIGEMKSRRNILRNLFGSHCMCAMCAKNVKLPTHSLYESIKVLMDDSIEPSKPEIAVLCFHTPEDILPQSPLMIGLEVSLSQSSMQKSQFWSA